MTQEQVDAINSGITKSIVDSRVIPSDEFPGYALYAVNANYATQSDTANTANYAYIADTANTATTANTADTANTATTAEVALIASEAQHSETAISANTALSATYAPDYTPLSTFIETLGDLSSIIHGI